MRNVIKLYFSYIKLAGLSMFFTAIFLFLYAGIKASVITLEIVAGTIAVLIVLVGLVVLIRSSKNFYNDFIQFRNYRIERKKALIKNSDVESFDPQTLNELLDAIISERKIAPISEIKDLREGKYRLKVAFNIAMMMSEETLQLVDRASDHIKNSNLVIKVLMSNINELKRLTFELIQHVSTQQNRLKESEEIKKRYELIITQLAILTQLLQKQEEWLKEYNKLRKP